MTDHDPMAAIEHATTPTPPEEDGLRIAGDTPTLQEVTRAALRAQQAQADLTHAASRARQAGDSIAAIAGAVGVTRQTIYRWTSDMGGDESAHLDVQAITVEQTRRFDLLADQTEVPPLVGVTEAAQILGVTPQAVRQRIQTGSLHGIRVGDAWALVRGDLH